MNGNIVCVEEEIERVKKMLKLNSDGVVKVDNISDKPFEGTALEQPKPNGTSHNVAQQTVNNDSNETEVKQASGSTTADPAVEQSTPVSSSKAPTNGTLPKVASPSETKNGGNNGAVVLYQMPRNQERLCYSPELENFLSRNSLGKEMLFSKVVPSSLFTQSTAEQAAGSIILVNQ